MRPMNVEPFTDRLNPVPGDKEGEFALVSDVNLREHVYRMFRKFEVSPYEPRNMHSFKFWRIPHLAWFHVSFL